MASQRTEQLRLLGSLYVYDIGNLVRKNSRGFDKSLAGLST